ncbi:MAG: class I SAM-dependent methyltransferase [Vicinamibacterales bacterium]
MNPARFQSLLLAALDRRAALRTPDLTAYRIVDGRGDALEGLYLDRYGPATVLNVYDDARLDDAAVTLLAATTLETIGPDGVEAVYVKRFARDRSRLGGLAPEESRSAAPRAGRAQPEAIVVREYGSRFEIRLYDGFSTGLFLEHREHRRALVQPPPRRALNLFAYTCGFAVPLMAAGAHVTNVDVSNRYLSWGRRNLALNGLDPGAARFYRMDALAYLAYAARHPEERFDLIILDPPTFAAGDPRQRRKPWRASADYPDLVRAAAAVLAPGGAVFAASNARELAEPAALARAIERGLGRTPTWTPLPPWPVDVREHGRVAAACFTID